ncbi:uncharacterized protein APUU_21322S [Aspergillus puulaauensis]|uniref:NmrA-like domain-containing protein n=1 Tax=Aspergillus puulaauensis TaxID=1220207 RepID=A0A7R8AKN5_9EURO|nr:uncharacterized protein APUU_21322S [Aspergillus puulaauensis]BCS20890.1 hypothetical protein APUU_21322S [Aspergillus puulaauensis]
MKIAIAGTGDLSHYFYEELPLHGHETITLTRFPKTFLSALCIEQRVTDYTVPDLVKNLADCDAVISTIAAPGPEHATVHLALLEACKLSPKCKKMIPSEFAGNVEEDLLRDEPVFMAAGRGAVREALRAQREVKWTLVVNGWFAEYLVSAGQRYFADLGGAAWPMDYGNKMFTMYGDGEKPVTLTSARDVARAMARLVELDADDWEEYTHLAGETVTWAGLYEMLKGRGGEWEVVKKSYEDAVEEVEEAEMVGGVARINAQLQLMGYTEINRANPDKAKRHKDLYFHGLNFRGIEEIMGEAELRPDAVI